MTNKITQYRSMERARDPSGQRTAWIIENLAVRPRSSSELFFLAENNGLGFAKSTYTRDLKGLLLKRLIYRGGDGKYGPEPMGLAWLDQYKKDWGT